MKASVKKIVFHPLVMAALGLLTGFLVKMMDIHFYAQHFGVSLSDIFSQAGVWVVIGVAISLYSPDNPRAMVNIFLFCAGMLLTYYVTAEVTGSIYGWSFIKAWAAFACLSPLMAFLVRLTLRPGALALVLKLGVFAGYVGMNLLLGSFLHYYDLPLLAVLAYLLFWKRWNKPSEGQEGLERKSRRLSMPKRHPQELSRTVARAFSEMLKPVACGNGRRGL